MAPALGLVGIAPAAAVECTRVSGLFMQSLLTAGLEGFRRTKPLSFKRAVTPDTLTGFGWSLAIDHLLPSLTSRASTSCASHPAAHSDRSKHWLILIFTATRHH